MKNIIIVIFCVMVSRCLIGQNVEVRESRLSYTDYGMKLMKVSLYFIDSTTHDIIDSIDLAELNPFNHLPLKAISYDERYNKVYEITSRQEYEKLYPKTYRERWYDPDYIAADKNADSSFVFDVILKASYDLTINKLNGYVAISFSLVSSFKEDDNPNGAIGVIMVFDNKKNLILRHENSPGSGEMAISDDGKYFAYHTGCMGPDVVLIQSLIEIIEVKTNRVVFKQEGDFSGPSSGYYPNVIQFSQNYNDGYTKDYYFNTHLNKIYFIDSSLSIKGRLVDILPTGLTYQDSENNEFFVEFEKVAKVIDIK